MPLGGQANAGTPPGSGYGHPPGPGYGQPGGYPPPRPRARARNILIYVVVAVLAATLGAVGVWAFQHPGSGSVSPQSIPSPAQNAPGNANAARDHVTNHELIT
ncbi:MAG TPA: hypothetical protein VIV12_11035 [Streptosporangiaceae bacterium]